jgi:hypothetical protein
MRRRRSLAFLASVATGGCLGAEVPSQSNIRRGVASFAQRGHPYENDVLTVAVAASLDTHPKLGPAIEVATTYWETHAPRFADFPVSYSFEPNAPEPDVVVRPVETIDHCGEHSGRSIAGCAPRVTMETVRPDPATVRIEAGLEEPFLTRILKHEFGHTLGLDHQDEPQHVMSSEPETWVPQYEQRRRVVDAYTGAVEHHNTAIEAYNDGTEQFNADAFPAAIDQYERTVAAVETTRRSLDRAVSTAREIGATGVVENAEESAETIAALATSAESLAEAAAAYEKGDVFEGKRHQQRHTDAYESYREGRFHPASTIINLLGMPAESP